MYKHCNVYIVSTDIGVPCLFNLACFFFPSFSHLSLKYLSHYIVQFRGYGGLAEPAYRRLTAAAVSEVREFTNKI